MQRDELVADFETQYGYTPSDDELAAFAKTRQGNTIQPRSRVERNQQQTEQTMRRRRQRRKKERFNDQPVMPDESSDGPEELPKPVRYGRRARVSIIGALLGALSLFSFYKLPFLQITLPTTGERTIYLSDLLNQSSVLLNNLGVNSNSINLMMFALLICPVLYIITQLIPSFFVKALGLLVSFIQFLLVAALASMMYSYFQHAGLATFNIDIKQFFGVGCYLTLVIPLMMFCWSLFTIAGKKVVLKKR